MIYDVVEYGELSQSVFGAVSVIKNQMKNAICDFSVAEYGELSQLTFGAVSVKEDKVEQGFSIERGTVVGVSRRNGRGRILIHL